MSRTLRLTTLLLSIAVIAALLPLPALSQGRRGHSRRDHRELVVTVRGHFVFVGGYFYDPYYGRYPWWQDGVYRHRYAPRFDVRADVRIIASPREAAVYVDGFYAGVVDDFDGIFQSLPVSPGGHEVVLYLEGFRTIRESLYVAPGTKVTLRHTMALLDRNETSELPSLSPPVPPPPAGTFHRPRTPEPMQRSPQPKAAPREDARAVGTLELSIQPMSAVVMIDGKRWMTSSEGEFEIDLPVGSHLLEVSLAGYRTYSAPFEISEGKPKPVNISLARDNPR
jgi:hypothetical protein